MPERQTPKYKDGEVATQHNKLINSQQSLSLIQKRIFYLAIKQIRKGDKDYKRYYIDLADLVPGTSQDIYHRVANEVEDLMAKVVRFPGEMNGQETVVRLNLVSKVEHIKGTGQVYVDLHPDIRDMLIDLKRYFTRIPVVELIACRSTYGQRLYELLYQFADTGIRLMPVKELREKLNLQNKYANFAHLRKRVLKQAQKDVEAHTNMSFQWREIKAKRGRKIDRLIFDIEITDPEQVEIDFDASDNASTVDMSKYPAIQKHLREVCSFSDSSVKKVFAHLEDFPDDEPVFHELIYKTEIRIKDGQSNNARPVYDPEAWTLKLFNKVIPNFGE